MRLQTACPAVERVVLWGLCDAASAALMYWQAHARCPCGRMVLLNPWVRSDATIAKTQLKHYYGDRFLEKEFWTKLLRGGVDVAGAVRVHCGERRDCGRGPGRGRASEAATFQDRMAEGLRAFVGPVLILLSERDLTAKEFVEYARSSPRWRALLDAANVERHDVADADHTFSTALSRSEVEVADVDWLRRTLLAEPR